MAHSLSFLYSFCCLTKGVIGVKRVAFGVLYGSAWRSPVCYSSLVYPSSRTCYCQCALWVHLAFSSVLFSFGIPPLTDLWQSTRMNCCVVLWDYLALLSIHSATRQTIRT